ncbi:MAG: hypothetical protein WB611_25835 [Stellaceae bacterium]
MSVVTDVRGADSIEYHPSPLVVGARFHGQLCEAEGGSPQQFEFDRVGPAGG